MSKYGYVGKEGDVPQQAFKSNAGVLSVNDHLALSQDDKLTQFGNLELIKTETPSGVSTVTFEELPVAKYNTFFLTYTFHTGSHDVGLFGRFGYENLDGTYSYEDANNRYSVQRGEGNGTFAEYKSTSMWAHQHVNLGSMDVNYDAAFTGYAYLHNMGDSTKYSTITVHSSFLSRTNHTAAFNFGSGVFPTAKEHNAYYIAPNTGNFSGTASMYGIRNK